MRWPVLTLLAAIALTLGACGDSAGRAETSTDPLAGYPTGPTREFILPGADNAVQEFGREATAAEREQVSKTAEAWLRARVRRDWTAVCGYMSRKLKTVALEAANLLSGAKVTSCPRAVALVTLKSEKPRYNVENGIVSLRIKEGQGYAQYHGTEGRDWVIPVQKEGGVWMVAHLHQIDRLK